MAQKPIKIIYCNFVTYINANIFLANVCVYEWKVVLFRTVWAQILNIWFEIDTKPNKLLILIVIDLHLSVVCALLWNFSLKTVVILAFGP